jgi:hypothetical protein
MPALPHRHRLSALCIALLLAGCGGGSGSDAPVAPVAPPPTTLSGTVAVGAPITDGKLRVIDANGAVVVADHAIAADGTYAAFTLTGPAPWRIEACGFVGPNYACMRSVAQAAGTANVTPLTEALLLLASGQQPETLMTGTATGLNANTLAAAQDTLRTGLAPVLADAGVSATLDLVSGTLNAGSRTGYDRVLDAVGVSTGVDERPFVQISPRLGSGNLYIEQGSTPVGALATSSAAAQLPLAGLEGLFRNITRAAATSSSCGDANIGMATLLSSSASLSMDEAEPLRGPAQVAAGLCTFLAGGDGEPVRLGARFLSPTLGRCDFTGDVPVCGVSFVLQHTNGDVEPVGQGMGVTYEAGAWKFKGDLQALNIQASARVQRDRRIDGDTVVDSYSRALAFEVPALPGLACAKIGQRTAAGAAVTLAYFKPHAGARRLSVWRAANDGSSRSLDPAVGFTRTADDTWTMLPQGDDGDAAVRNFVRGGRTVTVSLYSDEACSVPFNVAGRSSFEADVEGVPPVWSALPGLPWPTLSTAASGALRSLALEPSASWNLAVSWGYTRGSVGVDGLTFCSDRALCGEGDSGRLGEANVRPGATAGTVTVRNGATALGAGSYKMLAVYGRTSEGVGMQSNHMSCPTVAAGVNCEH